MSDTTERTLGLSDLTRNQVTGMQIFAAYAVCGAVKKLILDGDLDDPVVMECLARYETYADEVRSRRTDDKDDDMDMDYT